MRVLVIEDDALVAIGIKQGLLQAGFTVDRTDSAESAENYLRKESYDLALVDIGLPGSDGLSLIRRLRLQKNPLPVLVLSARVSLEDTVRGLDVGADDYLTKPFRLPELVARIHALIRRSNLIATNTLQHGALSLNTTTRQASLNGLTLELTPREWSILEVLLMASPQVVSKVRLLQTIAGWEADITPNAVEVHLSRLRAKLAPGNIEIRTVRGIGYRIDPLSKA